MRNLIITNGGSAGGCLKEAYPDAQILPWRDLLHEGPVPLGDDLSAVRADYIGQMWDVDAQPDFAARDEVMSNLSGHTSIRLWFEHDLYDQLQLLQVLDALKGQALDVELVQADDFLGHDTPDTIKRWQDLASPVTEAQYDLASKAWLAFRQETPSDWAKLLDEDTDVLPHLHAAVLRMLEELPSARSGISRTERHILEAVNEGAIMPGQIFKTCQSCEEAQFMGNWSFFERLDRLTHADHPALSSDTGARFLPGQGQEAVQAYLSSTYELTAFGQDVLAEDADFAGDNPTDFWWGGTHITPTNLWRWDAGLQELVRP